MAMTDLHKTVLRALVDRHVPITDFALGKTLGISVIDLRPLLDSLDIDGCIHRHRGAGDSVGYTISAAGLDAINALPHESIPTPKPAAARAEEKTTMSKMTTRPGKPGITRQLIADMLKEQPEIKAHEIIKATGLTGGTVTYHLKQLRERAASKPRLTATLGGTPEKPTETRNAPSPAHDTPTATFAFWSSGDLQICKGSDIITLDVSDRQALRNFMQLVPEQRA